MTADTMTFNKYAVEDQARHLLDREGLHDWTFSWSNAKRQFGVCRYKTSTIALSEPLARRNPDKITDTILHEIAHALAGHEAGHGPKWKRICRDVGAEPTTCVEGEVELEPFKWMGTCQTCGQQFGRYRLSKKARAGFCPKCYRRPSTSLEDMFQISEIQRGKIVWKRLR